jgi:hypothetical protein
LEPFRGDRTPISRQERDFRHEAIITGRCTAFGHEGDSSYQLNMNQNHLRTGYLLCTMSENSILISGFDAAVTAR